MNDTTKKQRFKQIVGEVDDSVLSTFLSIAKEKILRKAYPFTYNESTELPEKYDNLHIEIAVYLYNKQGAEGETYHSENGIIRTYEKADVPDSMLKTVIPKAGVI